MEQTKSKKKGIIIGVVVSLLLIVTLGITYAYWLYSNTLGNETLVAGDIYMKYSETSDGITLENAMPSKEPDETKHFDFTIEGKNKYSKPIWYEIVLSQGLEDSSKTRLKDEFLRFRLVEIQGEERKVVLDNASYSDLVTGKRIWVNTINANTPNVEIKYELYMWIGFETRIGNTKEGNDYTMDEWNDVYASVKVSVNGDFEEKKLPIKLIDMVKKDISKENSITDTDGTIYLSGSNDTINFNYVWYSGKLWRIVAINPDGTIKLVTQDEITAITWNSDTTYKNSWIYQWLNEDFKETLYNYENIIVQNADWNATAAENSTPVRPDSNGTIVNGDVGLLNAYEYSQAYKNASTSTNYLNIGYYWWLITPYSGSNVRRVNSNGSLYNVAPGSLALGVRPSINLKSNIGIVAGGDGSETNPYRINGDKNPGNSGELINTRISGEYVEVDNKKYDSV